MKKTYLKSIASLMTAALIFAGCSANSTTKAVTTGNTTTSSSVKSEAGKTELPKLDGKKLSVIATSEAYKPFFEDFTKKTGAKIEFLSMSSGEVLARAKAEGKAPADIWFGGGIDAFMQAKTDGLLEQYKAKNIESVNKNYRDSDNFWLSKGITTVGFVVNDKIIKEKNLPVPKTWTDLLNPAYKGEIIMSNPAISGTNYAAVKGILDMMGNDKGWDFWTKLNENIAQYSKRGGDPLDKTKAGEFAIGIIPVSESSMKTAKDNGLTVIWPEDGIPWVPEGVAIFKNSPEPEVAKAFIDFMLLPESMQMLAKIDGKDTNQMVVEGLQGLDLKLPKDKLIKQDLSTFGTMRKQILEKFGEISKGKVAN